MTDAARCRRIAQRAVTGLTTVDGFDVDAFLQMELDTMLTRDQREFLHCLFLAATALHVQTIGSQRLARVILSDSDQPAPPIRQGQ